MLCPPVLLRSADLVPGTLLSAACPTSHAAWVKNKAPTLCCVKQVQHPQRKYKTASAQHPSCSERFLALYWCVLAVNRRTDITEGHRSSTATQYGRALLCMRNTTALPADALLQLAQLLALVRLLRVPLGCTNVVWRHLCRSCRRQKMDTKEWLSEQPS